MSEKKNYGMVTEQGDLGLGFFAMNESEAQGYEDHQSNKEDVGDTDEKE